MDGSVGWPGVLPFKRIDQVLQVGLEKVDDDPQGILIRGCVEIKCAAQKVAGTVGQKKLPGGGCVAANVKKNAAYAVGCMDERLVDGTGFDGVLVNHLECIVAELVEIIGADLFIADVYPGRQAGEVDIDPIRVLGDGIEEAAVLENIGVDGIVKAEWVALPVEGLVFMGRKVDPEVSPSFWRIRTVAG